MPRRDPRRARVLGLWTAGWLAVFLVAGMLWLGEPSVQWPVLAVPLLWALLAVRPRRRGAAEDDRYEDRYDEDDRWDDDRWNDDRWDDDGADQPPWDAPAGPRPAERTDTVERPALRRPSEFDEWGRRRPG